MNLRGFIGAIAAALVSPLAAKIAAPELTHPLNLKVFRVQEFQYSMDEFAWLYIDPAIQTIADNTDRYIMEHSGWSGGGILQPGDIFTIAGEFA